MRNDEIGIKVTHQEFVDFLNSVQPGQFFHVKGYINAQGEKSDHWLRFGIKYGNLKARDVSLLQGVLSGQSRPPLLVTHGVWVDLSAVSSLFLSQKDIAALHPPEREVLVEMTISMNIVPEGSTAPVGVQQVGTINPLDTEVFSNRRGKGRVPATISYALPCHHPLVVAAIGDEDLQGTLLQGLLNPHEATTEYDKEARSCYSKANEPNRWYIRDVLTVKKVVRVPGNYEFTASLPVNGVKKAIQSEWLLTGKYRQFVLTDGQFEAITIEGQSILCDGIDEEFYFALPEAVKTELAVAR